MADPRFFARKGPFDLAFLAEQSGCSFAGGGDTQRCIQDVAALDTASQHDLACLHNAQFYADQLATTQAGAVVLTPKFVDQLPPGCIGLVTQHPHKAFALIATLFYPNHASQELAESQTFIAPTAAVHPDARLADGVYVSAGAMIGANATVGQGTWIGPNAVVDSGVMIGARCFLGANVVISHTIMGDRVRVDPGACIGQPGFGFYMDHRSGHIPVPQLGLVKIGNDVVIGSQTAIDRGSMHDTIIGDGCMIDNLVQIAHNVQLGRHCVVVAQVGISGSTSIGHGVTLAGQAGVTGHLSIGDGAVVVAQSGVMRDVPAGATVAGSPAVPALQWRRQIVMMNQQTKRGKAHDAE